MRCGGELFRWSRLLGVMASSEPSSFIFGVLLALAHLAAPWKIRPSSQSSQMTTLPAYALKSLCTYVLETFLIERSSLLGQRYELPASAMRHRDSRYFRSNPDFCRVTSMLRWDCGSRSSSNDTALADTVARNEFPTREHTCGRNQQMHTPRDREDSSA